MSLPFCWFWFGKQKHDKNIYLPCVGWMVLDSAVIIHSVRVGRRIYHAMSVSTLERAGLQRLRHDEQIGSRENTRDATLFNGPPYWLVNPLTIRDSEETNSHYYEQNGKCPRKHLCHTSTE